MKQITPHASRRISIQVWFIFLIGTAILMASMGCKKTKPFRDDEPAPADLKTREWLKKLAYPQHGQGCDTAMNGRY
jgi:hypothetical protein